MVCNTYKIGERIRLTHIKTDKFKKARLTIGFILPIKQEKAYLNSMIMPVSFWGTENHKDFQSLCIHSEELYASGITDVNSKIGDCQIIGLHASMLNDEYVSEEDKASGFSIIDGVFDISADIILRPLFREADVEAERANQIQRVRARRNDAFGYAKYRFSKELFDGAPSGFPLIGEEDQLASFTLDDLKSAYVDVIENAPIEIFYCGTLESDRITGLVKKYFSEFISNDFDSKIERYVFSREAKTSKQIEESGEYRQGNLLVGFKTGTFLSDKDFYACEMMNQIYGDGSCSKLFRNLREEKSLCYFCASNYDEARGVIVVGCGINNSDFEEALSEILNSLESIKRGEISDEELSAARKTISSDCRAAEDHPGDYEAFARTYRLFGGPESIGDYLNGILKVTKEDIRAAAEKMTLDTVYFLRGTLEDNGEDLYDE